MRGFLRKTTAREPLAVAMIALRTGERVLQIGLDDPALAGVLAAKTGISGNAAIVVSDERTAARARKAAEQTAALIDARVAPLASLPFEPNEFDVVVVHNTGGMLAALSPEARIAALREGHRVLRQGGRAIVVEAGTPVGLRSLLKSGAAEAGDAAATTAALQAAGFAAARVLADREGHRFVEGLKK